MNLSFCIQPKPENAVTIAVSSRVLFRTEKEQKVFEERGVEEYLKYQMEHENEPFAPGPAFPFVKVTKNKKLHADWTIDSERLGKMTKNTFKNIQDFSLTFHTLQQI